MRAAVRAAAPHVAAGAGLGALAAASLPPLGWWPAQWAAWAGVALLCHTAGARRRAATGAAMGVTCFAVGLGWIIEFSGPGAVGAVVVSSAFVAAALAATPTRWPAVGLPSAVTLAEALRDRVPLGGDPMAGWALGAANGPLAPVVRLGGSLALVWCTVAAGAVLAGAGHHLATRRRAGAGQAAAPAGAGRPAAPPTTGEGPAAARTLRGEAPAARPTTGEDPAAHRPPAIPLLVAAAAVAVLVAGGALDGAATTAVRPLTVALVQGGGPLGTRAVHTDPDTVFRRALAESIQVRQPVDLVVWAESTLVSQVPFASSRGGQLLAGLATSLHTTLVVGVEQRDGPTHARNLAVAYTPQGSVASVVTKHHLVPFGEYVPARSLLRHLVDLRDTPLDTVPGGGPPVLATPAGRLGVLISFEVFFDGSARQAARGSGVLVVPTDTASFRSPSVTAQEVAACRLRAVETGRDVVVVAPTGVSAVVRADGSVAARTAIGPPAVIERSITERAGATLFDLVGSWAALVAAAGALVAAWTAGRRRWTRTGQTVGPW